jgi:hypothetical protein
MRVLALLRCEVVSDNLTRRIHAEYPDGVNQTTLPF